MSITIQRYSESEKRLWDEFIATSPQGTIFHTRRFLSYHPSERFKDHSLLFYKKGSLIAAFPAAETTTGEYKGLASHPGASYGGICTKPRPSLEECFGIVDSLTEHSREANFSKIAFRLPPRIFSKEPSDQLEFTLLNKGFKCEYQELSTVYPLEKLNGLTTTDILAGIPQKTRNMINKGLKNNLELKQLQPEATLTLYNIVEKNLSKFNATPTHSQEELQTLLKLFPNKIFPFGVYHEGTLVAGFFVFEINESNLHIFYSAQDYSFSKLSPLCFGVFELLCWATEKNYRYLNYGISTEERGTVINWGLLRFKESFGGTGTLRSGWIKSLV